MLTTQQNQIISEAIRKAVRDIREDQIVSDKIERKVRDLVRREIFHDRERHKDSEPSSVTREAHLPEATIDFGNPCAVRYASLLLILKYTSPDKDGNYAVLKSADHITKFILGNDDIDKIATIADFVGKAKR